MKIYADVLFFINLVSAYLLLDLTSRLTRCRPRVIRLTAASAAGAVCAVAGFCAGEYAGASRLLSVLLPPVIAFGIHGADTVRRVLVFALSSALMAGLFTVLSGKTQTIIMRNGIMYFDVSAARFCAVFAAAYIIITLAVELIKRRKYAPRRVILISLNGKTVRVRALCDSGNFLKEPLTGRDVIIAEWNAVRRLFSDAEYAEWKREPEKNKLWLIPYHSLGNTGGLIYAFQADDVKITEEKRSVGKIFIGVTNEKLSSKDEYGAVMGTSV